MRLSFYLISGFKIDNPLRAVIRVLAECRIIPAIKHVGYRGKAESWESKHGKGLSRVLANQTNGAPWLLFRLWEFCRSCKRNISVRPKTLERDKGRTRAFPLSFLPSGFYLSVVKQPRNPPLLHRHEIARIHLSSRKVFSEDRFEATNIKSGS